MGRRRLVQEEYPQAQRSTLVMDNLNAHTGASLYTACTPETARALLEKPELVYTPKHGSWLTMAKCEFSVVSRYCVNRRLPDRATVEKKSGCMGEGTQPKGSDCGVEMYVRRCSTQTEKPVPVMNILKNY